MITGGYKAYFCGNGFHRIFQVIDFVTQSCGNFVENGKVCGKFRGSRIEDRGSIGMVCIGLEQLRVRPRGSILRRLMKRWHAWALLEIVAIDDVAHGVVCVSAVT